MSEWGKSKERGRAALISTPPPSEWQSKSKSCCLSVLLCCDVAQAEPSTEQAALWTSTQIQDQPGLLRAGDPLPATSLASTACPPRWHVPRREPGFWRGSHCGLPGRDVRLCRTHPCPDSSLQPLHHWLLCSSGCPRTTLWWQSSVPRQRAYQSSSVCALQPPTQPLYAPAQPPLSGKHFNTRLQVREYSFSLSPECLCVLGQKVLFIDWVNRYESSSDFYTSWKKGNFWEMPPPVPESDWSVLFVL